MWSCFPLLSMFHNRYEWFYIIYIIYIIQVYVILWDLFLTFWVDIWLQMAINIILLTIGFLYIYRDSVVLFFPLNSVTFLPLSARFPSNSWSSQSDVPAIAKSALPDVTVLSDSNLPYIRTFSFTFVSWKMEFASLSLCRIGSALTSYQMPPVNFPANIHQPLWLGSAAAINQSAWWVFQLLIQITLNQSISFRIKGASPGWGFKSKFSCWK